MGSLRLCLRLVSINRTIVPYGNFISMSYSRLRHRLTFELTPKQLISVSLMGLRAPGKSLATSKDSIEWNAKPHETISLSVTSLE